MDRHQKAKLWAQEPRPDTPLELAIFGLGFVALFLAAVFLPELFR